MSLYTWDVTMYNMVVSQLGKHWYRHSREYIFKISTFQVEELKFFVERADILDIANILNAGIWGASTKKLAWAMLCTYHRELPVVQRACSIIYSGVSYVKNASLIKKRTVIFT